MPKNTVKIIFSEDKFYQDQNIPLYEANKAYDITTENGFADRWLRRGGVLVDEQGKKEEIITYKENKEGELSPSNAVPPVVEEEAKEDKKEEDEAHDPLAPTNEVDEQKSEEDNKGEDKKPSSKPKNGNKQNK